MQKEKSHNIFVRGFDKQTKNYIKDRAKKNGRSVSKEIVQIIQNTAVHEFSKIEKKQ